MRNRYLEDLRSQGFGGADRLRGWPSRLDLDLLFERLDASEDGSGVGLALAKRIVKLHGGRIWVESEGRGSGSSFCFTLPDPRRMKPEDPGKIVDASHRFR